MGKKCSGLIDWKSSLPQQVAQNTTEAEIQAAGECVKDIYFYRALLYDLGYPQVGSSRILMDSNTAMTQMQAIKGVKAARHYLVPLRKMQECIHLGIVHVQRVDTTDNPADHFTKPLPTASYWRLTTKIMGDAAACHMNAEYRDRVSRSASLGGSVRHMRAERSEQLREETKQRKASKKQADADQKSLMAQSYIVIAGLMNRLLDHGLLSGPNAITMPTDIDACD